MFEPNFEPPFPPDSDTKTEDVTPETEAQPTRRMAIKALGVGLLAALTTDLVSSNAEARPRRIKRKKVAPHKKPEHKKPEAIEEIKDARIYEMRDLAGHTLGDLYKEYIGIKGRIPEKAKISFGHQLKQMWHKKRRGRHAQIVESTGKDLVHEYQTKEHRPATLKEYRVQIGKFIEDLNKKIDWDELGKIKHLNPEEQALTKAISLTIDARSLVSYTLTELMPSSNGQLNKHVLDFLLREAGTRYVYSIPAMNDDWTSFGPYQFTSFALYDTGKEKRGASIIHKAVKGRVIPGSVTLLRDDDHHQAAYLFCVDNIANLVKALNANQLATLRKNWHSKKEEVLEYLATAHHQPGTAIKIAKRWLDGGTKQDYSVSCNRAMKIYAEKTKANYRALAD